MNGRKEEGTDRGRNVRKGGGQGRKGGRGEGEREKLEEGDREGEREGQKSRKDGWREGGMGVERQMHGRIDRRKCRSVWCQQTSILWRVRHRRG